MTIEEIEQELLVILDNNKSLLSASEIEDMVCLTKSGEPGIAFENFCTQLYEYDVVVHRELVTRLAVIGKAMDLDESNWSDLDIG